MQNIQREKKIILRNTEVFPQKTANLPQSAYNTLSYIWISVLQIGRF